MSRQAGADAFRRHPETAHTILARGGDCVLRLKGDGRKVKRNAMRSADLWIRSWDL